MKYRFTKTPLARGVGTVMAALLWHYKTAVLGDPNASPKLCIIYEPRTSITYRPWRQSDVAGGQPDEHMYPRC